MISDLHLSMMELFLTIMREMVKWVQKMEIVESNLFIKRVCIVESGNMFSAFGK